MKLKIVRFSFIYLAQEVKPNGVHSNHNREHFLA